MVSDICPSGGIGIRARLKIVSRKGCGFDSHLGHKSVSLKRANFFALFRFCEAEQCFLTTENSVPGSRKFRATARNYL